MGNALPTRLLLTGVPGAGKTHLREVLVAEHGYFGPSLNEEDPPPPSDALRVRLYDLVNRSHDPASFAHPVAAIDRGVVVEWGFPINDASFRIARTLRELGMKVVWLECDSAVARERFLQRGRVSVGEFDKQVARIRKRYGTMTSVVAPTVIQVLGPDGSARAASDLLREIGV